METKHELQCRLTADKTLLLALLNRRKTWHAKTACQSKHSRTACPPLPSCLCADTAKVKLQLQPKSATPKYRGLLGTCLTVAREEGASKLWAGLAPGEPFCAPFVPCIAAAGLVCCFYGWTPAPARLLRSCLSRAHPVLLASIMTPLLALLPCPVQACSGKWSMAGCASVFMSRSAMPWCVDCSG